MRDANRALVVVTQKFFDEDSVEFLVQHGCDVRIAQLPQGKADGALSEAELIEILAGAQGWIVGHANVTASLLRALPELKIISRRGVGYERVDTAAVAACGKVATIAVGGNDASVADHTVGMMLAAGRRFKECQQGLDKWDWSIPLGSDLYRKTVGVIGLGRIGKGVVQRLAGFEAKTLIYTPKPDWSYSLPTGGCYVDLDTLFAESDYVTLHAPLTSATRGLINKQVLQRMKRTAFLVNTARGELVNDADLLAALQDKQIAGAALDVFQSESDAALEEVTRQLIALPNVVVTPHVGASTTEGLNRTNLIASQCVVAVLEGRTPPRSCVVADGR